MVRWAVRIALGILAVVLLYLGVTFLQVWQASRRDGARPAQAIVVFGAAQYDGRPSPVLRARLDHANDLYKRGLARRVVVTGGRQPNDRFTEASVSADYLARKGIPQTSILREVSGRDSWESLAAAARFLRDRDVTDVVLVSDGFHAARINGMAGELGLEAHTSPAPGSPIAGARRLSHMGKETMAVAVGRVIGYQRVSKVRKGVRTGLR